MTGKPTWKPRPSAAKIVLPAGATDTHSHVFGPAAAFPYAVTGKPQPADAPAEALFALHDAMGIDRGVIVQSGVHGFDNSAVADAIAKRPGLYLGVALAPADVSDEALARLSEQGFRAIRFNYMAHLPPGADADRLRVLAPRLAAHGWHLQVHMQADLIEDMAPVLGDLPIPVVIDHMGRVDASLGMNQAPFTALLRLMEQGGLWVKVSGAERASRLDPPYADATPFAAKLVAEFPEQVLWGLDWPHPNFRADPPDDGDLVNLLPVIAPSDAALHRLMVDNPSRLYQFPKGDAL